MANSKFLKELYKKGIFKEYIFIILLLIVSGYLWYIFKKNKLHTVIEPLRNPFKKAFRSVSRAVTGAANTVADAAKKAAEETKKAAEAAAAEAKKIAEEAAMVLQINGLLKDFNSGINKLSDSFDSVGKGIGEIKSLGTDMSTSMKKIPSAFDKLSE